MKNILLYNNAEANVRIFRSEGVPSQTDGVSKGDLAVDVTNADLYQYNGSSWDNVAVDIPAGSIGTTDLADGAVTFSKEGTEVVDSKSYGGLTMITFIIEGSALDGNANSVLELPIGYVVRDVTLILTEVAGSAATVNVGTDDSNWQLHNDDPDAFVAAFDVNSSNNAVRMTLLDETNQTAAAVSGDATTGTCNIIATSSGDISGSNVSIVAQVLIARVDLNAFN